MLHALTLVAMLCSVAASTATHCEGIPNMLLDVNATGSEVVDAVIAKIESWGLFESDHCLLRRIAFVETGDGKRGIPPGGIWNLEPSHFDTAHKSGLYNLEHCNITFNDTRKPFFSGIFARLFLDYIVEEKKEVMIPNDTEGQAQFWINNYHKGNLDEDDFVSQVEGTNDQVQRKDQTIANNANGSDVVEAVIAKIYSSHIFEPDHRFLRRLAYVETMDGTNNNALMGLETGGIWALEHCKLKMLYRALMNETNQGQIADIKLANISRNIYLRFNLDVSTVLCVKQMSKPFFSGLIARLYLYYLNVTKNVSIPLAGNVEEQAQFWVTYYHPDTRGVTADYFVSRVEELEKEVFQGCHVKADIFFVLDVSGSVGGSLAEVVQFEYDFVANLLLGPEHTQVGTVIFNTTANTVFNLTTYNNTKAALCAIEDLKNLHAQGYTNIVDGLCQLLVGFKEENGARPASNAVFRIAIILTDGKSNRYHTTCNLSSNTTKAASEVRKHISPVLFYVIGVTDSVNDAELRAIATTGDYIHISSFKRSILMDIQQELTDAVCRTDSFPVDTNEETNGTLDENGVFRCNFEIPYIGITVTVCITEGHIQMYGSFSVPNPNSALYDFYLDLVYEGNENNSEICGRTFVAPPSHCIRTRTTTSNQKLHKRTVSPESSTIVYLAVVGKDKVNTFVLNSTEGNIISETGYEGYTDSHDPTTSRTSKSNKITIVVTSTPAVIVFISCILIVYVCYHCSVHHRKKRRQKQEEYYNKLLEMPQSIEYEQY